MECTVCYNNFIHYCIFCHHGRYVVPNSISDRRKHIRKWEDLTSIEKELKGPLYRKKSMRKDEPEEVLELIDNHKMQELKQIALRNYTDPSKVDGNKSWKKTWAKQVVKTRSWDYNTFAVGVKSNKKHPLCGQVDILLMIQDRM